MAVVCKFVKQGQIDCQEISRFFIATSAKSEMSADYFSWRYFGAFGHKTILVQLRSKTELIATSAIFISRDLQNNETLLQLGDLLVHPDHRSLANIQSIYNGLRQKISQFGDCTVFTTPNKKAKLLNKRYLGLNYATERPLKFGISVRNSDKNIMSEFCENSNPNFNYTKFSAEGCELLSSKRKFGNMPYSLILRIQGNDKKSIKQLLGCAAKQHKTPFYCYWNSSEWTASQVGYNIPIFSKKQIITLQSNKPIGGLSLELLDLDGFA